MTSKEVQALLNEFPETPKWIVVRDKKKLTLQEARDTMLLRREAFPDTIPTASSDERFFELSEDVFAF